MSRAAAAKSRTDKNVKSVTPAVTHEIVAGKLNNHDWSFMIDSDDGDNFGAELVEEIINIVLRQIFVRYIERQIIPYNVQQARDDLLQIIEWQFLRKDEGEGETLGEENGWYEDEEVPPTYTDCWAQGCVPRIPIPVSVALESDTSMDNIREEEEEGRGEETTEEVQLQRHISPLLVEVVSIQDTMQPSVAEEEAAPLLGSATMPDLIEISDEKLTDVKSSIIEDDPLVKVMRRSTVPVDKVAAKPAAAHRKYKRYTGPVNHDSLVNITQSLQDTEKELEKLASEHSKVTEKDTVPRNNELPASCHSMLRLQAGRPPGHRDIVFDQEGQVISVAKLDMRKLPSHKVRMSFQIVDPAVDETQARKEKKVSHRRRQKKLYPLIDSRGTVAQNLVKMMPAGPSALLDAIDVAPGVVIREGDKTRKGPRTRAKKPNLLATQCLHPINAHPESPPIAVSELLDNARPITIRPLVASPVIPPISH